MQYVTTLFALATFLQLAFWYWVFPKASLPDKKMPQDTTSKQGVSILLCFHNEATRLPTYLPLLLAQQHPNFEIVAVDDYSTDDSASLVAALAAQDARLRLLQPPQPTRPGKKDALTYAIQQAKHDYLLLTDADCAPASPNWLSQMTAPLMTTKQPTIQLVLGYSPYQICAQAGWINAFQRFETRYTALQYLGLAQCGQPYMGVGRNMAYHRSFFQAAGGFEKHTHLAGGDDDLLVGSQAKAQQTAIIAHATAWTWSEAAPDLPTYLRRKFRHLSVGAYYRPRHQLLLGLLALSHVLHYALGLLLLFTSSYPLPIALAILLRLGLVFRCYRLPFGGLNAATDLDTQPIHIVKHDFLFLFYYLLLAPALIMGSRAKGGWA